nr:hypothetical protein [Marmoricola sp. URHB0036]
MSETLREEKGHQEVAEDEDAQHEPDDIGGAHRSSTLTSSQNRPKTSARIAT